MAAQLKPHSLTVGESFVDPVGYYDPSPVFSWKLPNAENVRFQTAYRIVVSNRSRPTSAGKPIWDSGKVDSDQSVWVPYEGPALKSRQQISWRVKFWDNSGRESGWSEDARVEMGLLNHSDWNAHWIEMDRPKRQLETIKVLQAEFGNRTAGKAKVRDVTPNIRRAIQRGSTPIRAVSRRLGGDPAPGEAKTLWVDFEVNGDRKQVEIPENQNFDPYPKITAHPGYHLRREFAVADTVIKARLYVSALGICEFHINGKRVGADMLTPGYTMHSERVESLTYDVTSLMKKGASAMGALLGEGWYAGNLLLRKRTELLGLTPKVLGQLELTYSDGRVEKIVTDDRWRATDMGPIRAGGFYHGEDYEASKELGDWDVAGFDDKAWKPAKATSIAKQPRIVPKRLPPVRVMKQVPAVKLTQPEPGRHVFDFGQNLVGFPEITMPVAKGEKVRIRFAEMLKQDGTLYTESYRSARSQATYAAATEGVIRWQPALTFFGFRYLEISGLSAGNKLTTDSVIANVLHTDFESAGKFTSSHQKLNQLQSNIRWGQLGNFIDIPTDCPQRDERLGWTGDAQVFLPTSFFNYDVYSFWARWLQSVRDEQTEKGEIPHTVPATKFGYSGPGWADVIVTAPWEIYERTGDRRILKDNYLAMKKWIGVYESRSQDFIPTLTGFGDWLQPYTKSDRKGDTAQDLIATAYFGRDARILHWTATALGKSWDAKRFKQLHADIRRAFTKRYFPGDKPVPGADTQTACLMGLGYDLIEPAQRKHVESLLLKKFEEADRHLRTGFLGTPLLAPVFDELGHPDICYELLFKESYPSWFFSINQGATTMWERWNSYSHADGFGDASMNSFNHYAYGAIGQFMYERIAGLSPDPQHPGYKHFFIRPLIGGPLDWAKVELNTPYGTAESGWRKVGGRILISATVPPNSTATALLPASTINLVRIGGKSLEESDSKAVAINGTVRIKLNPGSHQFSILKEK